MEGDVGQVMWLPHWGFGWVGEAKADGGGMEMTYGHDGVVEFLSNYFDLCRGGS